MAGPVALSVSTLMGYKVRNTAGEDPDEELARRVEFELRATRAFDMNVIHVIVRHGVVTLDGRVASRAEWILADNIVKAVEGVRDAKNNLKVSKVA